MKIKTNFIIEVLDSLEKSGRGFYSRNGDSISVFIRDDEDMYLTAKQLDTYLKGCFKSSFKEDRLSGTLLNTIPDAFHSSRN